MTASSANGQPPFQLEADPFGKLVLIEANGHRHTGATVVRAFPFSAPSTGIAITSADGKELAWIDDLASLPPPLRRIIEEHLAGREFVPIIRQITHLRSLADKSEWKVVTDRGPTAFEVSSDSDVRHLDGGRALVIDTHGIRYLIADLEALDAASRRYLERFL